MYKTITFFLSAAIYWGKEEVQRLSKGPHHATGKGRNEGKKKEPEKIIRAMST